jgi:cell division protein FtsQ
MKVSNSPRLFSRVGAGLAVLAVFAGLGALVEGMNGPISVVRIRGDLSAAEGEAVQKAIESAVADGYLAVDLDEVTRAVLALSWPRDVAVRRVWPSVLEIELRKEAVAARWGEHAALSSSGEVIEVPQALGDDLPLLDCAIADGIGAMQTYQLLKDGLRETDLEIASLVQNDLGEWRATFDNGVELVLGESDLGSRLARFTSVYRTALASRVSEVARVDARYGNGVAVDWRRDAHRGPASDGRPLRPGEATPPRTDLLVRGLAVKD